MQSLFDYPIRVLLIAITFLTVLGFVFFNINSSQMQQYSSYVQSQVDTKGGLTADALIASQKFAREGANRNAMYEIINPKTNAPLATYVNDDGSVKPNAKENAEAELKSAGYGPVRYGTKVNIDIKARFHSTLLTVVKLPATFSFTRNVTVVTSAFVPGLDK